jgi:hypothetical protein
MSEHASLLVVLGIPGLAALVAILFVLGAHHSGGRSAAGRAALGVLVLASVTGALAASGLLARLQKPPLFMPMMLVVLGTTVFAARSALGTGIASRLPLFALVGAQAFRLPLELVMHEAATEGVMPVVMSFGGYNFDIVTGTTALVLGAILYFREVPRTVVVAWNVLGALLLFNIVTIAVAAAPWFAAFGPANLNEWVLHFPFVFLATVLVPAALFGHIVVGRRLIAQRGGLVGSERGGCVPGLTGMP